MKVLFLLFLGTVYIQGFPTYTSPISTRISTHEDGNKLWVDFSWSKVDNFDDVDPILGYKVKIWIVEKVKSKVYASNADGKLVQTEKEELPEMNLNETPGNELVEIDVPGDKTEATYHGIKKGVTYEIAIFAYTAKYTTKGSFSKKMRILVEPDKND